MGITARIIQNYFNISERFSDRIAINQEEYMWNFNNWSKSLDAYQRLQETQSKLHEFLSSDTTSSVQPDGGGAHDLPQRQRYSIQQAESQGRRLVDQAELQTQVERRFSKKSETRYVTEVQFVPDHLEDTEYRYSSRKVPYCEDIALIERFCEGALLGGSNSNTVDFYKNQLISISDYLQRQHMPAINARLFSDSLESDLKQYAFQNNRSDTLAIIGHLRRIESNKHGVSAILPFKTKSSDLDEWLIDQVFSDENQTTSSYRSTLRALSHWLAAQEKPGLCDPDYLHSHELTGDVLKFSCLPGRHQCSAALQHMRNYDLGSKVRLKKQRDTRNIPDEDQTLISHYQKIANDALVIKNSKAGKKTNRDPHGRTSVDKYASVLRSFSAWLKEEGKGSLSTLLHDPELDTYRDLWTHNKSSSNAKTVVTLLMKLREIFPPFSVEAVQEPSHSSFTLPNSEWSGWGWNPDTPQYPPQSPASTFNGLSSLSREFDLNTPQQEQPWSTYGDYGTQATMEHSALPPMSPERIDVDNLPFPQDVEDPELPQVTETSWLLDGHLHAYTNDLARRLQEESNAHLLHFADSQIVTMLNSEDEAQRNVALRRLVGDAVNPAPPIAFMPINRDNVHWSLLVVDRRDNHSPAAYHYDSMGTPHPHQHWHAQMAAWRLGLDASQVYKMPTAIQPDGYSCGDHVLTGIEVLAHRVIDGMFDYAGGKDLSDIKPDRDFIRDRLAPADQAPAESSVRSVPEPPVEQKKKKSKWWKL
ncbi:C48 family peptidase [Pseudomonas syringae]|uniref:C48 family peptidase n=1 Tax=Pseudomonas syringae TaxID=317 RepID=UPI0006E4B738|nr:C48 family peptidase [Pseudomonas syringae]KPY50409.1 Virulence protein [Pseudomonas syringae pv. rhaphiolepidis]